MAQGSDAITAFAGLFVRRPILALVLNLLVIVAGFAALQAVEVRELPNVDRPVISVTIDFPGASPETVDRQITSEVESAVARVSGIEDLSSQSDFGRSRVTIEFGEDVDLDAAASDVRDAVSRLADTLPDDAEEARVVKADANGDAVLRIAVTAPGMAIEDLTTLVEDRVADAIAAVRGVADVTIYGERERLIYVDVSPDRLATRGLTLGDVAAALQNAAFDVPAGSLASPTQQLVVRADAVLTTPEDFEAIYLDARTQIGDIATVRYGPDDAASQLRRNSVPGVGMGVVRQAGSSTLDISAGVRTVVDELNRTLPDGVTVAVTSDDAVFINGALTEVQLAILFAIVIVTFVIFLFLLNARATLIPAVTMPIALIGTLAFIHLAGFSLNILTLLALVLATGMVVDDAIIVLENIVRRRDAGATPRAAAVIGTRDVFFAVLSTTATLAAVFVPISFLPGQAGGLFREFGFVLAMAVVVSSFVALTLCPMMASVLLKAHDPLARPSLPARAANRVGSALAGIYRVLLDACLKLPLLVVVLAVLFSFVAYLTFQSLPQELTPSEDRGLVLLSVSAPQGASLEYTDAQVRRIEEMVLPYVESGEGRNVFSIVGRGSVNSAFMVLTLAPWSERERSQQEIVGEINAGLRAVPGVRAFAIQPNSLGIRGGGRGLQFAIAGQDFASLAESAERLRNAMNADGRWGDVRLSNDATQPQLSVEIDRQRASDLGIEIDGLATAVQALLDGREIGRTYVGDRQIPIKLVASANPINDPSDMANIFLKAGDGRIVPLSTIATVEEQPVAPSLSREDRARAVSLAADLPPGLSIQEGWQQAEDFAGDHLLSGQRLIPLAEAATIGETNAGLALVFGFAIVIILLVLAAQFESFVSALIIIATVPLGVACAIFALDAFGASLNLYSQIGLVLLVGIMAKNGILIVEFANQLRSEGQSVREAARNAALIRLRPVVMTMIATVCGGIPLLLASGAGSEARVALGTVIVGGLGLATISTLFVTPVAYLLLGRFYTPDSERSARLDRDLEAAEARAQPAE